MLHCWNTPNIIISYAIFSIKYQLYFNIFYERDNSSLKPNKPIDIGKGFKHPGDPDSIVEMGLNDGLDKTYGTK